MFVCLFLVVSGTVSVRTNTAGESLVPSYFVVAAEMSSSCAPIRVLELALQSLLRESCHTPISVEAEVPASLNARPGPDENCKESMTSSFDSSGYSHPGLHGPSSSVYILWVYTDPGREAYR